MKILFALWLVEMANPLMAADQLLAGTANVNITPASKELVHDSVFARCTDYAPMERTGFKGGEQWMVRPFRP